jgi:hypothetical protein
MKKMHFRVVEKLNALRYTYFEIQIKGFFGWRLYTTKQFQQEVNAIAYIDREIIAHKVLSKKPKVVFEKIYDLTK